MPSNFSVKHLVVLAALALIGLSSAEAAVLGLNDAVQSALKESPDLRQLEEQHLSAQSKARLALAPTEPTLSFTNNDLTSRYSLGTSASNVIQFTQPIGFPGRAFLNRSMLVDQADSVSYQARAMKLQVSVNVKTAYYNLQLARKNIQLNSDTKLAYERILSIAKRRYESGASGQVDYLNAQVALLSNANDLEDLQTAERQALAALNTLLKRPVNAEIEVEPIHMTYHPRVNLQDAVDTMLANRNEIKSAKAQEEAANKAYRLAWMSLLPDFQVTIGTTYYRDYSASPYSGDTDRFGTNGAPTHTYSAGLQFTVPLWFIFNEREAIVGAGHDRAAAEGNLDVVFNQSKTTLETAVDTLNSTEAKIENFEKHILPMTEQSLNLALIDYSSGKVDFPTLAGTAASLRQARLTYATAIVTYLTNYATYGQLIGEDFE